MLIGCLFFASCDDEVEHYKVPKAQYGTVVEVLEARDNFTHFLKGVEMLDMRYALESSSYTLFPPTDKAFEKYFSEKGISGLDDLSKEELTGVISNHVTRNAITWDKLLKMGWRGWLEEDEKGPDGDGSWAFKRPTVYQAPNPVETDKDGKSYKVWQAKKFLPLMADHYYCGMREPGDYEFLFGEKSPWGKPVQYTGKHVHRATVVEHDIAASNGVLHALDHVIPPLENIDRTLTAQGNRFGLFKSLLDRFAQYEQSFQGTNEQPINDLGYRDTVYVKRYERIHDIGYDIINIHASNQTIYSEPKAFTAFVPTDDALNAYFNETFVSYGYESIDAVPDKLIYFLVSNHLAQTFNTWVRPSQLDLCVSGLKEPVSIDKDQDVEYVEFCNNGVLYGLSKVLEPNIYKSVASTILFNPEYSFSMNLMFLSSEITELLSNVDQELTYFALSDNAFKDAGIRYDPILEVFLKDVLNPVTNEWTEEPMNLSSVQALLKGHVGVEFNLEDRNRRVFLRSVQGGYIGVEAGEAFGGGNQEEGERVAILSSDPRGNNGTTHLLASPLKHATLNASDHITKDEETVKPEYKEFRLLLQKTGLFGDSEYGSISFLGNSDYTILIPTNESIVAAVAAGQIPGLDELGRTNTEEDQEKLLGYLKRYFVQGERVFTDGRLNGTFRTLATDAKGDRVTITLENQPGSLRILNGAGEGNDLSVKGGSVSDIIARSSTIHQIDGVLLLDDQNP
ncbi:hypothetical protein FUAX_23560 [Fulvitalea axinellae]|uniref:FAS1 domain-containing protein n=1 Tax=Fulvitalea axinellae TaxID=1182444 RepID=A0AAU9CTZ4_9BACT|nr:hypothetical protein FUAX_23560 [Fulvitalea axinellae]